MTGVWVAGDTITAARMNEKETLSDTNTNITSATKYSGMKVYPTDAGALNADTFYVRNNANDNYKTFLYTNQNNYLTESAEQTLVTHTYTTSLSATQFNTRQYDFFTLGTTYKFVIFTGLEFKTDASNAITFLMGVDLVNADLPTLAASLNICVGKESPVLVGGITYRFNIVKCDLISLATNPVFGVWVNGNGGSQTALYFVSNVTASNVLKAETFTVATPQQNNTAWSGSSVHRGAFRVFYKGYS